MKLLHALMPDVFDRDIRRPVAVVDERTYRAAIRTIDALLDTGLYTDTVKAQFAIVAASKWLRYEIRTGRKSKRVDRARRLEQLELLLQSVNSSLGLPGSFCID